MSDTNQLSKTQFGFRPKFSTIDALLYATESWRGHLDKNKYTAVAALDLSKAFDSIDHEILLIKLLELGFSEKSCALLKNYLTDRHQAVKHHGVTSEYLKIETGVPQGTILGPLLFILYINDLSTYINCENAQYADDTLLFTADANLDLAISKLESDCNKLTHYFAMHKLCLNVSKTEFMILSPKRNCSTTNYILNIGNVAIISSVEIKYLGITIDNCLTFNTHVKQVLKKWQWVLKPSDILPLLYH